MAALWKDKEKTVSKDSKQYSSAYSQQIKTIQLCQQLLSLIPISSNGSMSKKLDLGNDEICFKKGLKNTRLECQKINHLNAVISSKKPILYFFDNLHFVVKRDIHEVLKKIGLENVILVDLSD